MERLEETDPTDVQQSHASNPDDTKSDGLAALGIVVLAAALIAYLAYQII